jgi:hypothetical protein
MLFCLLPLSAQTGAATNQVSTAPGKPIVSIGMIQFVPESVVSTQIPGKTGIVPPSLRVEFKMKDKSVNRLDTAVVHLFDKQGKFLQSLTKIDPSGYLPIPGPGGTPRKPAGKYPNMITELSDLRPGTQYNLIFPSPDKKNWKIAVAVVGNAQSSACVYKTIPTVVDVSQLEFKEKAFAVKD